MNYYIYHYYDLLQNFWKISIALIFLETYSNWIFMREYPMNRKSRDLNSTTYINEELIYLEDLKFYEMILNTALGFSSFIIMAYLFTLFYSYLRKRDFTPFVVICKAVTLSTCGTILLLPSLIWETHIQEFHVLFVSLYTTLSQLLAYKGNILKHISVINLILLYNKIYNLITNC